MLLCNIHNGWLNGRAQYVDNQFMYYFKSMLRELLQRAVLNMSAAESGIVETVTN